MPIGYDSICCFRSRDESLGKRVCWEITTDCNLKCPFCHRYCFIPEYYDINRLPETIALFRKNSIENIILSGGEPLLHPHFIEILDALHAAGFSLDVCSNGTLLYDDTVQRLGERVSEISISIDGYEATRHEQMRQVPGCFAQTMKGVDLLIRAGIDVHVTTVVDAAFAGHIVEMTGFLHEHGICSVAYLGLIPLDTGTNHLFTSKCQALLESQVDKARNKYFDMAINTKQLLTARSGCSCGAGHVVFGLGTDGLELHPCLLTRERSGKTPGGGSIGLCPGSRYLTQRKENEKC